MPHVDQLTDIRTRRDGAMPPSWLTGDTEYQKAAVIAAVAFNDIKAPDDPGLVHCDLSFREECIGIVESLMRGNEPDDRPFSQAAARRWAEVSAQPPTSKEIAP
jgi:hypothetical protein